MEWKKKIQTQRNQWEAVWSQEIIYWQKCKWRPISRSIFIRFTFYNLPWLNLALWKSYEELVKWKLNLCTWYTFQVLRSFLQNLTIIVIFQMVLAGECGSSCFYIIQDNIKIYKANFKGFIVQLNLSHFKISISRSWNQFLWQQSFCTCYRCFLYKWESNIIWQSTSCRSITMLDKLAKFE